jgi:hypothetical protein
MNKKENIQTIDLKLPKNARLFYIPKKDLYVVRYYDTNIMYLTSEYVISYKSKLSMTSYYVLYEVLKYLKMDIQKELKNIEFTNKNEYTQRYNKMSQAEKQEYSKKYTESKWKEIAEQIYKSTNYFGQYTTAINIS